MIDALVTSIGRSGAPPGSSAASFMRAVAIFAASRAASRRSVLGRFAISPTYIRAVFWKERSLLNDHDAMILGTVAHRALLARAAPAARPAELFASRWLE